MACKKDAINAEKTSQQNGSIASPLSPEVVAVLRRVLRLKGEPTIDETDFGLDKEVFIIDNSQLVSVQKDVLSLLRKTASTGNKNKPAEYTEEDRMQDSLDWYDKNFPHDKKGNCTLCFGDPESEVFKTGVLAAQHRCPGCGIHQEFYR